MKMKIPHNPMQPRNREKGLRAMLRCPLTASSTSSAAQNVTSISGISKYEPNLGSSQICFVLPRIQDLPSYLYREPIPQLD